MVKTFDGKAYAKKYYTKNREKLNSQSKEYYKNNREKLLLMQKTWARKRLYGLSEEEYNKLVLEQENRCKICGRSFEDIKQHIDHCHSTGKVRGLLCIKCNVTIGQLGDSLEEAEETFNKIKRYLINGKE